MPATDIAPELLSKPQVLKLYFGKVFTGVTVEPDGQWQAMWRICLGNRKSDMINLSRAKDAAMTWAPMKIGGGMVPQWRTR